VLKDRKRENETGKPGICFDFQNEGNIEDSEEYRQLASYSEHIQAQLSPEQFSALQKHFDAKMEAKRKDREQQ